MSRQTTYEEIRRIDPAKFADLESTMRMLYDHGNMQFDDSQSSASAIPQTNASMREPKSSAGGRGNKSGAEKAAVGKRKTRPDSLYVKPP